jgi:arylsulfatase A-like enzyme
MTDSDGGRVGADWSRPDVLYITVDSMRADRVGAFGGADGVTPVIDDLATEGLAVDRAVANGIPTYYSFKSLLGGIHALGHRREIGLPETATPLAELFAEAGYATAGFNARNPWLTPGYGYDRGFETFQDFMGGDDDGLALGQVTRTAKRAAKRAVGFSDALTDVLGRSARTVNAVAGLQPLEPAESVTDAAVQWLRSVNVDRSVFLWVHYMDPHYPWVPPAEYLDDDAGDISRVDVGRIWHTVATQYHDEWADIDDQTLAHIEHLYEAEIRRTDAAIDRLLDAFQAEERFEQTVVTVTGDHGTELADHGGFSHGPRTLYDEIVRVPLVVCGPGVPDKRVDLGALLDVPPTSLGLVDGVSTPDTYEGIDLLADERTGVTTEVVFDFDPSRGQNADNGLLQARTDPPWKLVRNQHTGTTELYDLGVDPDEQSPVDDEAVREQLAATLDDHRATIECRNQTVAEKQRIRRRIAELRRGEG